MTKSGHQQSPLGFPLAIEDPERIPALRYYDKDFYELECERLWPRVWQMACRLDEIRKPGDFVEYEILDQSVIVTRVDATTVKAYHNACRHRGVQLVKDRGSCTSGFTCPFHGWCWGLDGANTFVFEPHLFSDASRDQQDLRLRECRLELWGGCAFINLDDDAPPLRECIEPFASFHDAWKVEELKVEWWMSCRLPVNWKLAMEAFMEGYHVMETHPELVPPSGGRGKLSYQPVSESGPWRTMPAGSPPPGTTIDSRAFIDMNLHFMRVLNVGMAGMIHEKDIRVAEGLRSEELPADLMLASIEFRKKLNDSIMAWNKASGVDLPDLNAIDEQGLDSAVNFCFPHYFLLPVGSSASSYRIRPLGPEETLFEIWSLTRYPEGEEPAAPMTPIPLGPDDPRWPPIPRQDFSNLPRQQKGLHTKGFDFMRLSPQVEGMISNYHRLIDGYLAGLGYDELVPASQKVSGPIDAPIRDIGLRSNS